MTTELRPQVHPPSLPPLESGDRLTRPEFERRYAAAPHIRKAELIEGIVYVASPLRHKQHGRPHSRVMTWLGVYQAMTPGMDVSVEPTVRLDLDNEPQPDAVLFIESALGGQTQISDDGYIEGPPELVVEVAASSVAIDRGSKKQAYRRNGISEYIIWQSYENQLEWFDLVDGEYKQILPDADGIIRSPGFPGLWLAVDALLNNKMQAVLETLQQVLTSEAHQQFVAHLAQRKSDASH
ncbi:MAG: Uma2 family endonuclease [Thermosynechococcaceae cyanobacterium]